MEVTPLFSSNLVQFIVKEKIDQLNDDIKKEEFKIINTPGSNNSQISANRRVLEKCPRIKKLILKYFNQYSKEFLSYDGDFDITTSWFTKVEKGSSQFHFHKNSFYSAVLYFGEYDQVSGGSIQFNSPIEQLSDFQINPNKWFLGNANLWGVYPIKNLLLFFPSYLSHRIEEYYGENPRYSLAVNIVPIGKYGEADSTYNTNWF